MKKLRMLRIPALLLVGVAFSPVSAFAQTVPEAGIAGTIKDPVIAVDVKDGGAAMKDASPEETLAWQAVLISTSTDDVFAFIQTYPDGPYTKDAKALMIDLLWTDLSDDDATPTLQDDVAAVLEVTAVSAPEKITALPTEEIELQSLDGLVAVSGVIIAYDDALITIQTSYGTVGIENDGITCIGATCPTALLATP